LDLLTGQQQQSFSAGHMHLGAVSRLEGPLFTNKQERQTLLTIAQASTLQLSTHTLLPSTGMTTALDNSLDMCFSALYMHELHRKYHHGDYIDLDKVKEETDELDDEENAQMENLDDTQQELLNRNYEYNNLDSDDNNGNQSSYSRNPNSVTLKM
jgi:hypothetical protein